MPSNTTSEKEFQVFFHTDRGIGTLALFGSGLSGLRARQVCVPGKNKGTTSALGGAILAQNGHFHFKTAEVGLVCVFIAFR
jgi:hypothetical protein